MPSQPAIILNASSGAGDKEQARAALASALGERGHDAVIWLARSGAELLEYARRAVLEDRRPVVAGGGDGTVNAVASVLVGTERPLGVLPLGTLNHFAKDLRIPLDLDSAIKVCLDGQHAAQVDVGEVNGRIFLNNSSLGLYPSIVRQRERQQERQGWGKWPAFFWAALAVLRRYPFMDVRLSTDRKDLLRRTPFVFIGNNEYQMEGFGMGERARLDAGQLSLTVAHRTGRLGLLRFAMRALFGGLRNEKDFDALSTSEVWVETKRSRLRVATDGEVTIMHTPLHYRVRPGALRVLVPAKQKVKQ
jgi:diacylglycerol kinase family enzyme